VEPVDPMQALVDDCRAVGGLGVECEPMYRGHHPVSGARPTSRSTIVICGGERRHDLLTANVNWDSGRSVWPPVGGYAAGECTSVRRDRAIGNYFAEQARLEAASVRAFLELANALTKHGAPRMLVQACRRAAGEEIVHAVLVGRLAVRHGVTPQFHRGTPSAIPTLEELAHANAVEGCLRETWGAMVATWQGRVANDPTVRAVMQRISIDETKHAMLSRAIDRWAMHKLDAAARARILIARAEAFAELASSVTADVPAALSHEAGLPRPEVAATLLTAMHAAGALG
jgi:hypothetical protein